MSFFAELTRRNVFRVGAAYLVVAWLLLQVLDTVGPIIGLPIAFAQGVLLLLALGFPLTLVISWVYEVTPEGITTQDAVDAGAETTSGRKLNAVIIGGLVLVLGLVVLDDGITGEQTVAMAESDIAGVDLTATQDASEENSIAVLPFENLSNDPDQEYFSDGMTEELINRLSGVNGLLVTGRASAFYFKDSVESPQQIANALGVMHILQGTVRKSGNQLRISTTLMNANTGFNLWTQTFDRQLEDIFVIQDEISEAVTTALSVSLGAGEFNRSGMTRNVGAYDAWLQATASTREEGLSSSPDAVLDRIQGLEYALSLDPEFALAWIDLAVAYANAGAFLGNTLTSDYLERRDVARTNAFQLAPDMPELFINQGVDINVPEDFIRNEGALLALLEDSGSTNAALNGGYARFLYSVGRLKESQLYAQRAYRLDPYSPSALNAASTALMFNDNIDEARVMLNRQLMLGDYQPGITAYAELAFLELTEGNWAAAREATNNTRAARDQQLPLIDFLERDDFAGGLAEVQRMMIDPETPNAMRVRHLNVFAALMGDPELAVELVKTIPSDLPLYVKMRGIMQLWGGFGDEVRPTQGFKELVEEMGLANYWRSTGNWADFCRPLEGNDDFECF